MSPERAKLNSDIASALGWRVWQYPRDEVDGLWFMERKSCVTVDRIEVREVPNYISILREDLKMHIGDEHVEE